jgi:hypothetical protein
VALHEHRCTPLPDSNGPPRADTVGELRAQISVILSDPETPNPDIALSGETMHTLAWGLHEAVKTCPLPNGDDVTEEAGKALYHLGALANALHEAASTTAAHIYQRAYDLNRALGRDSYDRRAFGATYPAADVACATESEATPDADATA